MFTEKLRQNVQNSQKSKEAEKEVEKESVYQIFSASFDQFLRNEFEIASNAGSHKCYIRFLHNPQYMFHKYLTFQANLHELVKLWICRNEDLTGITFESSELNTNTKDITVTFSW